MRRTYNLLINTIRKTCRTLPINWLLYSVCMVAFNTLWILLPESISLAITTRNVGELLLSGLIGLISALSLFLSTYLGNNAWMQLNKVRYSILLDLLNASLRIPFSKTLDPDYLAYLDKARHATMNPSLGIGYILTSTYELFGVALSGLGLWGIVSRVTPFLGIFVLISVFISFGLNKALHKNEETEWDLTADAKRKHEKVYDSLMDETTGKDIRLFPLAGILDFYGKNFLQEIKGIQKNCNKEKIGFQILLLINELIRNVIVYIWLAAYILSSNLDVGSFLTYALGVLSLSSSVQSLLTYSSKISKEVRRFSDYWRVIAEADSYSETSLRETEDFPESDISIEFAEVSFTYPNARKPAILNLSFTIKPGCQTALVGLNGAGKSTIIKLLCRLYKPDSGVILINGVDIQTISPLKYYDMLSVVLQTGTVLPFSVKDNIVVSNHFSPVMYERAVALSGFREVENFLPNKNHTYISHVMDSKGIELSGGEKQKLLLSRAIYKNGRIFLLDEPTGAIDPMAEEALYCNYKEITRNSTSLIISHQLSFVKTCDYIIMLVEGKIAEQGTHSQLMEAKGHYYEMYMEQKKQYQDQCKTE